MVLPAVSSNDTFSSLPMISSCARAPPAGSSRAPAPAPSASSRIVALMVSSRWLCVVGATLPWPSRPRHGGTPMAVAKSRRRHFLAGEITEKPALHLLVNEELSESDVEALLQRGQEAPPDRHPP